MTTKAVFFDLYYTLIDYYPSREQLQVELIRKQGYEFEPARLSGPLHVADRYFYEEFNKRPLSKLPKEELNKVYIEYERILLAGLGITVSEEALAEILMQSFKVEKKMVLYDDVVPALSALKERGIIVGIISNMDKKIDGLLASLGLDKLTDVVMTSYKAGTTKPNPGIFQQAMEAASVSAEESVFVGDQYEVDIVGARSAGMKALLIDRNHLNNDPKCQSIDSLKFLLDII